jgi:hypothetical protein
VALQGAITTCLNLNPGFSLSAQDDAGMEARSLPHSPAHGNAASTTCRKLLLLHDIHIT